MDRLGNGQRTRVEFFDVAKAIAIIAVILGHTAIRFVGVGRGASLMFATCFTFHLPLFFFVSGYFLHVDRPFDLLRTARQLVVPYAATASVVVAGVCVSNMLLRDWGPTRQLFFDWSNAAIYGAGDIPPRPLWPQSLRIGAIWFLLALFWSRLTVWIACRTKCPALIVAIAFLVGYLTAQFIFLPFDVQSGLCGSIYVYLGTLARQHRVFEQGRMPHWMMLLFAVIWIWAIRDFQGFGMAMCGYGSKPLIIFRNLLGGLAGTMCVLYACKAAEQYISDWKPWKLMCVIGSTTLPIMCVHLFEDDVVRWGWIVSATAETFGMMSFGWLLVAGVRVAIDCSIAMMLVKTTIGSWVFGGPKR